MSKIKLVVEREKTNHNRPLSMLLLLIAGVYGVTQLFLLVDEVTYSGRVVYTASSALCVIVWCCYFFKKKWFPFLIAGILSVSFAAFFLMRDVLQAQFSHIISAISGAPGLQTISVTQTALLLAVFVSLGLFVFEVLLKNHVILYLLTSALLLLSPLLGMRPRIETVVVLVFFQIVFWALHLSQKRTGVQALRGKPARITALILLVSLIIAFPLVSRYSQELYDLAYEAEGYVYRSVSELSGRAGDPITGGRINRGNNYRTGTGHLELTVSKQPTDTLYLRGFGGGEYIGGDWIRSSDEALFVDMEESLQWDERAYQISPLYYSMYFELNDNMITEEPPASISLRVRHFNGEYENAYVPYYSERNRMWGNYSGYGDGSEGYTYHYFEQKDMNIDWDNVSEDFEEQRDQYQMLQEAYVEAANRYYTRVPIERLPKLTALVEENPLDELNEISTFILHTLHSNASYTLTPGWAPLNEDIAEYFLFERGRGYCEHFALTATLLYRLYGIPARYATGYMVSSSDFEPQEDETYRAVATDEHAHAWVEIFLENYGWTPVEVTPASDGSTVARYPGFDSLEFNRILSSGDWNMTAPSLNESPGSAELGEDSQDWVFEWTIDFEQHEKLLWVLGTCFLYSIFMTPLFLNYFRLKRLKKIETMNCRKVFSRYMQMLHFAGCFQSYDGSEEEFPTGLTAEIPTVSREEITQMQSIVSEAAFGFKEQSVDKDEFVRSIYFRTSNGIYKKLKWYQKLLFRYWKAFG